MPKYSDNVGDIVSVSSESGETVGYFHARFDEPEVRRHRLVSCNDLDGEFAHFILQHSKLLGPSIDPISQIPSLDVRVYSGGNCILRGLGHVENHISKLLESKIHQSWQW